MASPQPARFSIAATPGSRVLQSPLSDDAIWKRLRDAGFDEESIKRRDKAALIAYIAKLEAEIFDHQHHMGLLILERKEWATKYEQIKTEAESAEIVYKRDQSAHSSALAEARKREDSLKKALEIEKECIANLEKALHEMRQECAETKVAAEIKLAEAHSMVEDAQKRFVEAEAKLHAAEAFQAEAICFRRTAERKLQEVEAREDDLRRHLISFKSDCDEKEKEIILERQSLSERQKNVQQGQERLLDGQALLNQREEYIFSRSQELNRLEKELEASKSNIEKELRALNEEKSNLELKLASLTTREEDVVKREALLNKKEHEILILQEKIASKESDEVQKLMALHEIALKTRKAEFEAELETKRKLVEDEIEAKRRASELREVDLSNREDFALEREHELEVQSRALAEKEKDVTEKLNSLDEKEKYLNAAEKDVELEKIHLEKEKEEINKMKLNIEKSLSSLEDKKKQVDHAKEKVEAMKSETSELLVLEMKLKEEIDVIRAQKLELMAEADELRAQKANFEAEWESIDEKREELRNEAERIAEERLAISKFLKDERDSLKLEKDAMRDQYKQEVESLSREREDFMSKMVHERSEWFSKIQQERADFLLDIEMQKKELENCIDNRREELESYFKEREKTFEQEKMKELQHISSMKERVAKELEHVASEMKRLDAERMEINLDHERRDREWAELSNSIEELKMQRQKLKKQRELLHADRKEIHTQIEHLKKLEDLKIASDNIALAEMQQSNQEPSQRKVYVKRYYKSQNTIPNADFESHQKINVVKNGSGFNLPALPDSSSPSTATPFSWFKRCAELIFKLSPEKPSIKHGEKSSISNSENANLTLAGNLDLSDGFDREVHDRNEKTHSISDRQPTRYALGEPKVILEVPSSGEDVKGLHTLESEIKKDTSENSSHSFSEKELLAGRKRRVVNSSSNDWVDTTLEQRQKNKKRRQQENAADPCGVSIQSDAREGQDVSISLNQTQGGAEETNLLITDEIIKISEVTCENVVFDNQAKPNALQNSVAELGQDIQHGGTNGLADSNAENCVLSSDFKAQEKIGKEVLFVDVGQVIEHSQPQDESISEKSQQELQEQGVPKSDDDKKLSEKVGDNPVIQSLDRLKQLDSDWGGFGEMVEVFDKLTELCSIEGSDNAAIATRNGGVEVVCSVCSKIRVGCEGDSVLVSGLTTMASLLHDVQSTETFQKIGGPKIVVGVLNDASQNVDILNSGFSVVAAAATGNEILKESFMDLQIDELIIQIMKSHGRGRVHSIYDAICVLLTPDDNRVVASQVYGYARRFAKAGIAGALVESLGEGLRSPSLVSASIALKAVAVNDEICKSIAESGGIDAVLRCIDDSGEQGNKTVARACCSLLSKLAGSDANKSTIVEKGGMDRLIKLSARFSDDPSVLQEVMPIFCVLSLRSPDNAARAVEAGAGDLAIQAMQKFPAAQQMQRNSCLMIRNLVVRNQENRTLLLSNGIEKIIRKAKENHESCKDAANDALRDLGLDYNS